MARLEEKGTTHEKIFLNSHLWYPVLTSAISDLTIGAHRGAGNASRYSSCRYLDFYEDTTMISRCTLKTGTNLSPQEVDRLRREDLFRREDLLRRDDLHRQGYDESPPPSTRRRSKKSSSSDKPRNPKKSSSSDKLRKHMESLVKPLAEGFEAMQAQQKKTHEQVEALAREDDEEPLDPAAATINGTTTRPARFGRRAALEFERMNRRLDEVNSKIHRATSSAPALTKALADTRKSPLTRGLRQIDLRENSTQDRLLHWRRRPQEVADSVQSRHDKGEKQILRREGSQLLSSIRRTHDEGCLDLVLQPPCRVNP
ncbi:unnamed protein product [Microthlaspi erraticum]|uniref:Uncharacterized protein n=1 Tax=Microthlaspi erraticum TaxID=1685480 RepID=A0A6D2JA04_9BRAS|nr:unnamed protein product [Microthlaspi erraticum]